MDIGGLKDVNSEVGGWFFGGVGKVKLIGFGKLVDKRG